MDDQVTGGEKSVSPHQEDKFNSAVQRIATGLGVFLLLAFAATIRLLLWAQDGWEVFVTSWSSCWEAIGGASFWALVVLVIGHIVNACIRKKYLGIGIKQQASATATSWMNIVTMVGVAIYTILFLNQLLIVQPAKLREDIRSNAQKDKNEIVAQTKQVAIDLNEKLLTKSNEVVKLTDRVSVLEKQAQDCVRSLSNNASGVLSKGRTAIWSSKDKKSSRTDLPYSVEVTLNFAEEKNITEFAIKTDLPCEEVEWKPWSSGVAYMSESRQSLPDGEYSKVRFENVTIGPKTPVICIMSGSKPFKILGLVTFQ